MQSVTFLDGENCHYVGEQELSGTWSKDDDAVVIAFPGYESMTLKKAEGEESYTQSGWEDLGERYFPTEEEAIEYRDEFLAGCDERVAELLESTTWRLDVDDRVRKAEETITFKDGEGTFTKGEYDKSLRFNEVPDDGAWIARDHSGEYTVEVDLFTASRVGSSMAPRYAGGRYGVGRRSRAVRLAHLQEQPIDRAGCNHSVHRREGVPGIGAFAICA